MLVAEGNNRGIVGILPIDEKGRRVLPYRGQVVVPPRDGGLCLVPQLRVEIAGGARQVVKGKLPTPLLDAEREPVHRAHDLLDRPPVAVGILLAAPVAQEVAQVARHQQVHDEEALGVRRVARAEQSREAALGSEQRLGLDVPVRAEELVDAVVDAPRERVLLVERVSRCVDG